MDLKNIGLKVELCDVRSAKGILIGILITTSKNTFDLGIADINLTRASLRSLLNEGKCRRVVSLFCPERQDGAAVWHAEIRFTTTPGLS
jgi:hypothetical protein